MEGPRVACRPDPGSSYLKENVQWAAFAGVCATEAPERRRWQARRAQQKKAAGGLNLAEMNGAMNDGMEPSEQNLWLIIYGYTIL